MLFRLKTTNISSDKFADTIEVICHMVVTERKTWNKYDLANKPKPIFTKVCDPENFKFILKGLTANNTAVLNALIKLLAETKNVAMY
jgi:hypothetical protein